MSDQKLVGQNYTPPDLIAKVTGRAKYAEDYRADGMLFTKLLLSPMPHARVRAVDASAALALPGVKGILRADDLPDLRADATQTERLVRTRPDFSELSNQELVDHARSFVPLYRRLPWAVKRRAMFALRMTAAGWTPPPRRPGEPWRPPRR